MKAVPVQIIDAQYVANIATSYYTSPANKKTLLTKCTLTNVSGAAETVDVHLVPNGGSPDASNRLITSRTLDINEAWPAYPIEGQVLNAGDQLYAVAGTGNAVLIMASGVEVF